MFIVGVAEPLAEPLAESICLQLVHHYWYVQQCKPGDNTSSHEAPLLETQVLGQEPCSDRTKQFAYGHACIEPEFG
jgi:hypothetical protein